MKRKGLLIVLFALFAVLLTLSACSGGGVTQNPPPSHTHRMVHQERVEATCEANGCIEHWKCSDCGKLYADESGTTELTDNDSLVILAKHPASTEIAFDETGHWYVPSCAHEGVKLDFAQHTPNPDGYCTLCGNLSSTDGLTYTETNGGQAYLVSGIGTANAEAITIGSYHNGKPIVGIADRAFENQYDLKSITFAPTVKTIGAFAFSGCSGLTAIQLDTGITSLGTGAFKNCDWLASVTLGGSLEIIGSGAFESCNSLHVLTIGNSVKAIDSNAFKDCGLVTSVHLGTGVATIGDGAFAGTSISLIVIPENVSIMGSAVFENCANLIGIVVQLPALPSGWSSDFANASVIFTTDRWTGVEIDHNNVIYLWSEWSVLTPATCLTPGEEIRTCINYPSRSETRPLPIADHCNLTHVSPIEAKCGVAGNVSYYRCIDCDTYYSDENGTQVIADKTSVVLAAKFHTDYLIHVPYKAATCTETGIEEHYICESCGGYFYNAEATSPVQDPAWLVIGIALHSLIETVPSDPTCEEDGTTGYYQCEKCFDYFKDVNAEQPIADITETVIPATGHAPLYWRAVAQSCQATGNIAYYECLICHLYYQDEACKILIADKSKVTLPQLAHTDCLVHHEAKAKDTCTDTGNLEYWECTGGCGVYYKNAEATVAYSSNDDVIIAATWHSETPKLYGEKAPSCTEPGNIYYIECLICHHYYSDDHYENEVTLEGTVIPATHHLTTLEERVAIPATCTEVGTAAHFECTACHLIFSDNEAKNQITDPTRLALPCHTSTLREFAAQGATCTENGNTHYFACTGCGTYFTDETAATAIEDKASVVIPATNHQGTVCYQKGKSPTCTESGIAEHWQCSACDKLFANEEATDVITDAATLRMPATNHQGTIAHVAATAATCATPGNIEYWRCMLCDDYFANESATIKIPNKASVTLIAGHTYATKWSFDSNNHWRETTCGHNAITGYGAHVMENNRCTTCDYCVGTDGLEYTLNDTGDGYIVTGIGIATGDVVVSSMQNGLPVIGIAETAFKNATQLTSIVVPASVEYIEEGTFSGCYNLTSMILPFIGGGSLRYSEEYGYPFGWIFGQNYFNNAYTAEQSYTIGYNHSMYYEPYIPQKLTTVVITGGDIPDKAFMNMYNLISVTLKCPAATTIAERAFSGCSSLTTVDLSACTNVTVIGESAFSGCYALALVDTTAMTGLQRIENYAFSSCYAIKSFNVPSTLTYLGASAFYNVELDVLNVSSVGHWLAIVQSWGSFTTKGFYVNGELTTHLVIPEGITTITEGVLAGLPFTGITIPASVTKIEDSAFANCTKLETIVFKARSERLLISSNAFYQCDHVKEYRVDTLSDWFLIDYQNYSGQMVSMFWIYTIEPISLYVNGTLLTELTIPASITDFTDRYFRDYDMLTTLYIPKHVKSIGAYAFAYCENLQYIVFEEGCTLQSIGDYAFQSTKIESITIPDSVTQVGSGILENAGPMTFISLPFLSGRMRDMLGSFQTTSGLQVIIRGGTLPSGAFANIYALESVILPEGITEIPAETFYYCYSLKSVKIPSTLTTIGEWAFYGCEDIEEIELPAGLLTISEYAFYECQGLTSIAIPDSVTTIGNYAFANCRNLANVTIGRNSALQSVGSCAFSGCKLTAFHVPALLTSLPLNALQGNPLATITLDGRNTTLTVIGNSLVENGTLVLGTSESFIPADGSITAIGKGAFSGSAIESIVIPSTVTTIADDAFYSCQKLSSVTIENGVKTVGVNAFAYCTSLSMINFPASVEEMGLGCLMGCSKLTTLTIPFVGNKLTSADQKQQYPFGYIFGTTRNTGNNTYQEYYGSNTSWTTSTNYYIPATVKNVTVLGGNILYGAFYNCATISTLTILSTIDGVIQPRAFYYCTALQSLTLPEGVTTIKKEAFEYCYRLNNLTLPSSLTRCDAAFDDLTSLNGTTWGDAIYVGNEQNPYLMLARIDNKDASSITVHAQTKLIASYAFRYCYSLTEVTISDSVREIGYNAFLSCNTAFTVKGATTGWVAYDGAESGSGTAMDLTAQNILSDPYYTWRRE